MKFRGKIKRGTKTEKRFYDILVKTGNHIKGRRHHISGGQLYLETAGRRLEDIAARLGIPFVPGVKKRGHK